MKNFIATARRTDKKVYIGMATLCVGWTLSLLGAYQDGINDTIRAAQKFADENPKEND